jgi:hypothetical protein
VPAPCTAIGGNNEKNGKNLSEKPAKSMKIKSENHKRKEPKKNASP